MNTRPLPRRAPAEPPHPYDVLYEDYMLPLATYSPQLARALKVPKRVLDNLVTRRTGITADLALRLAKHFNTTPELWLNLQMAFDLWKARRDYTATYEVISRHPDCSGGAKA